MSLDNAYSHIISELQLDNVKESLKVIYDRLQKSHNAIHELALIGSKMFPSKQGPSWHVKSAFLLYHSETFDSAHRSFIEALCGSYNVAFVLLRSVLELLLKGAFYECLAHKEFRIESTVLDKDRRGRELKQFLQAVFKRDPTIEDKLEKVSAGIYDKLSPIIDDPEFRPYIPTIIKQLVEWGIFEPITNPSESIWSLYQKLSKDVHVIPDRTDIGRVLLLEPGELFEPKQVMIPMLEEYVSDINNVTDIGIVTVLNIFKDNVRYDNVKINLGERLHVLEQLELEHSLARAKSLIEP